MMVDGIRGDADKVGDLRIGADVDGEMAAQSAKQRPAGALSLQPSASASVAALMAAAVESSASVPSQAGLAQGGPVPLQAPDAQALTPARVDQAIRALEGGVASGTAAIPVDINQMMLMMFEMSRALRTTALHQRAMSQEANIASQTAAITAMRDAAMSRFIGAFVDGAAQIGLACWSFSQTAATSKLATQAEGAQTEYVQANALFKGDRAAAPGVTVPTETHVAELKTVATAAQRQVTAMTEHHDAIQRAGTAMRTTTSASSNFAADQYAVAQRKDELDATRHDIATNSAAEMATVMRDRANEVLQTLRAIHQSLADAASAINRNM